MAIVFTDDKHYQNIAHMIRDFLGNGKYKPEEMHLGIQDVYFKGEADGYKDGINTGKAEGQLEEYDAFWDALQDYGNRTHYAYTFAYGNFNADNFKPKYPIVCTANNYVTASANSIFRQMSTADTQFDKNPIKKIEVPIIVTSTNSQYVFDYCEDLEYIELIDVIDTVTFTRWFYYCTSLSHIRWNGVIGQDLDLQFSPLDKASLEDTIAHLKDDIQSPDRKTVTFKAKAVTEEYGSIDAWEDYVLNNAPLNWRIALSDKSYVDITEEE